MTDNESEPSGPSRRREAARGAGASGPAHHAAEHDVPRREAGHDAAGREPAGHGLVGQEFAGQEAAASEVHDIDRPVGGPDVEEPVGGRQRASRVTGARRRGRAQHRGKRNGFVQWLKELPILLAVAFIVAVLLKSFVVQAFWIPSGSMEQTLHGCPGCTGDRILVNRMSYWFADPQPGDIVVFQAGPTWDPEVRIDEPNDPVGTAWLWVKRMVGAAPPGEKDLVKRVVAVGGQTIECCDAQQRVLVDGQPLDEPYVFTDGQPPGTLANQMQFGPVVVPEGRLFVMGDHRNASADSRFHLNDQWQGTIATDSVIGRAFVIVYPLDRFGWLDRPEIQPTAAPVALLAHPPVLAMLFVVPLSVAMSGRSRRRDE